MAKIGDLFVLLGLDIKDYQKGLKDAENKTKQTAKTIEDAFKKTGENLKKIGQNMALVITAPLMLIGRNMIKMAMDAVESENLFEVSMGNMADAARQWSIELSKALGLNQYELRRNVGTFNVMLRSMGLGEQAAFNMAKGLTQLAYDMASFYNLKPEEAFEKLRSGITGEAEPLKQLGIIVLDETAKQYAYKAGIAAAGEELTEQQKVLARYIAIMDQTSKAQGDLARTIDSPANKARIAQARFEELQITLGMKLLPIFSSFVGMLDKIVTVFSKLPSPVQTALLGFLTLLAVSGPLLFVLGQIITVGPKVIAVIRGFSVASIAAKAVELLKLAFIGLNAAMTKNPVIAAILIISGAMLALAMSSKTVRDWLDQVIARLKALAGIEYQPPAMEGEDPSKLAGAYADYARALGDVTSATKDAQKETKKFLAAFDEVYQVAEDTDDTLGDLVGLIPGLAGKGGPPAPPGGGLPEAPGAGGGINIPPINIPPIPPIKIPIIQPEPVKVEVVQPQPVEVPIKIPELQPVWVPVLETLANAWAWFVEKVKQGAEILELVLVPVKVLVESFAFAWQFAVSLVQSALLALQKVWETVWSALVLVPQYAIQLAQQFALAWQMATAWVQEKLQEFQKAWETFWAALVLAYQACITFFKNIGEQIVLALQYALDKIKEAFEKFREWAGEAWRRIGDAILKPVQDAFEGVRQLFDGLKDKVSAGLEAALAWIKQMWENHKTAVLATVGLTIAGIVLAFTGLPGLLAGAAARLLPAIIPAFTALVTRAGQIFPQIASFFSQALSRLPNLAQSAINGIVSWFTRLPSMIWNAIKSIPSMVSNALRIPGLSVPKPAFAVPGAQAGGIFMKPAIIGIAEKEPEAAIPLSKLNEFTRSGGDVHLHVGVLVADERGLKELERRLRSIRLSETSRTGAML